MLRKVRDTIDKLGIEAAKDMILKAPSPKLWRILGEAAMAALKLDAAEEAFIHCKDYFTIQIIKKIKNYKDDAIKQAEIAAYFGRHDEAEDSSEESAEEIDRCRPESQSYLQWKHDLTGPVIVAGGSYSGALSAWHRIYLPSLTVGGWSSSGVVNALVEYPEFDQSISESAGTECAAAMRNLTSALETANTADPAALRRKFNADENMSDPDFF